ncbi:hypothetical protein LTR16_007311, partial [Cryomyces antarcticus]
RIAAILGDLTFTLTRRVFLTKTSQVAPTVPSWSYLASYFYGTPVAGTFHASDIQKAYGQTPDFPSMSIQAYYLSFINTMDPNKGTVGQISWPQWSAGKQLLNFNELINTLLPDSFRSTSYDFIAANAAVLHV